MAQILSGRSVAPGSNNHNGPSHQKFLDTMKQLYPDAEIVMEPRFFQKKGLVAFIPDFSVTLNGVTYFFEIKRQGERGNAHERVYKVFSPALMRSVKTLMKVNYYPVVAVFCDNLATDNRYLKEFQQNLEPDSYIAWRDYDPQVMRTFCDRLFERAAN